MTTELKPLAPPLIQHAMTQQPTIPPLTIQPLTVQPLTVQPPSAHIESLDHEGRGVAHVDGKAIFIEGALPREQVTYQASRKKKNFETAHLISIQKPAPERVSAKCVYYGLCGGCILQHADYALQVAAKQREIGRAHV